MTTEYPVRMYRVLDRSLEKERKRVREYDVDPPMRMEERMVAQERREMVREIEQKRNHYLAAIVALRARGVL